MVTTEYNQCVDAYADRLYRFALKVTDSNERAMQVVKESFSALWNERNKLALKEVKMFLFANAFRKIAASGLVGVKQTPEPSNPNAPIEEILDQGLQSMTLRRKALVVLRDFEGTSYQEIADISSLRVEEVKTEIYRARKDLKSYLVKARFSA